MIKAGTVPLFFRSCANISVRLLYELCPNYLTWCCVMVRKSVFWRTCQGKCRYLFMCDAEYQSQINVLLRIGCLTEIFEMVECTCTYYRWLQWGVNHAEQCVITSSNGNTFHVLATCAGNSPFPSEFPAQRPVTRSFVVFFVLYLNEWLSKQSWAWWFETPSHPL